MSGLSLSFRPRRDGPPEIVEASIGPWAGPDLEGGRTYTLEISDSASTYTFAGVPSEVLQKGGDIIDYLMFIRPLGAPLPEFLYDEARRKIDELDG